MQDFLNTLDKQRHEHYDYVVEQAERWTRQVTGIGLNEELKRFNRRESESEYEQRVNLTVHISKSISNKIANGFKKPYRASGIKEVVKGQKELEVKSLIREFSNEGSLTDKLEESYLRLNLTDPNAFLLMDVYPFNGANEKPITKIVEIPSKDVLDYISLRGEVVSLSFVRGIEYLQKDKLVEGVEYININTESVVKLTQVDTNEVKNKDFYKDFDLEKEYYYDGSKFYSVTISVNNLGYVPAMRAGYIKSITTKGETFDSIIDVSMPYYLKLLDSNSEFDLSNRLHAFPQKSGYYPKCTYKGCVSGQDANGDNCQSCNGQGYVIPVHSSAQDFIGLPMPNNSEDMIDISKLFTYLQVDTKTMEYQRDQIQLLEEKILDCIFNNDIYSKVTVEKTATETNSKKDNVNDTLYSFALGFSHLWKFFVQCLADFNGYGEDLSIQYIFPNDFKLETLGELIDSYKAATESNAPSFVVNEISLDIARKMFADNPIELEKFKVSQQVNPFSGQSAESIKTKMLYADEKDKYLYSNLTRILKQIELDDPEYYTLPLSEILARVDEIVEVGVGLRPIEG